MSFITVRKFNSHDEKRVKEIILGTTEQFIAAQRFYEKKLCQQTIL